MLCLQFLKKKTHISSSTAVSLKLGGPTDRCSNSAESQGHCPGKLHLYALADPAARSSEPLPFVKVLLMTRFIKQK